MNTPKETSQETSKNIKGFDESRFTQHPEGFILQPTGPQKESHLLSNGTKEYSDVPGDVMVTDEMGIVRGKYSYLPTMGVYGDYEPMNVDATSMAETLDYIAGNAAALSNRARSFVLSVLAGSGLIGLVSSCTGKENPTQEDIKAFTDTIENTTVKPSYHGNTEDSIKDLYQKGSKIEDYFERSIDGDGIVLLPDNAIDLSNEEMKYFSDQYKKITQPLADYIYKNMANAEERKGFPYPQYVFTEGNIKLTMSGETGGYSLHLADGTVYDLSDIYGATQVNGAILEVNYNNKKEVDQFFKKVEKTIEEFTK